MVTPNIALQKELGLQNPRLILGGAWWNGHDFCQSCIVDALVNGTPKSSQLVLIESAFGNRWNMFNVNRKGALIDIKKKHWFF